MGRPPKAASSMQETVSTIDDLPESIEGDVIPADTPIAGPAIAGGHHGFCGDKVRVVINEGDGELGKAAVYVALNEYAANIPRDKEVLLPKEVFEACIRDAKVSTLRRTEKGIEARDINRFSYSMLGVVPA